MIGKKTAVAALLLGLAAAPAYAGSSDQQSACRSDVRRFCHQVQGGGGDDVYLSCLQAHRPRLSASCRHMLEANGV